MTKARPRPGKPPPDARRPKLWGKDSLVIDRISQEGRGVARRAGKIVFVSGALAGEQVKAQCTAVKRDYDEADLIEHLSGSAPSPQRVQPECPVYGVCGGCSLQHWSLPAQQLHKQANLLALLRTIAPALVLDAPITAQQSGFRHRLRLRVTRRADRSYVLGLRQRRSHEAVNLQHCMVASSAVNQLLLRLPDMLLKAPDLQGLREIEIDADSSDQMGLCFYFAAHPGEKVVSALHDTMMDGSVKALRIRLAARGKSSGDHEADHEHTSHRPALFEAGELCLKLAVPPEGHATNGDTMELAYLPGDFTQTRWDVNAALIASTLDWLQPRCDETALDLFSGIGNFSLPLARRANAVKAMEGDRSMTERTLANAKRNGIANLAGRTLNLMADEVVLPSADIAIVDPPRAGAKAVCAALARSKVRRLLYISCHPATLARDAKVLHNSGLRLCRAAVVDMFPHTGHSEAIALFQRK